MNYYHFITILIGLGILGWSFWASFEAKKPYNIIGSIFAPIGMLISLLGVLLLCVPDFFKP